MLSTMLPRWAMPSCCRIITPENAQADIQKLFGSGFAESVADLSIGQWHGPVLSGYGVHLVYVHSLSEPPAPVFAEVRDRVAQDWEDDRRETLNEQFYASLRARTPSSSRRRQKMTRSLPCRSKPLDAVNQTPVVGIRCSCPGGSIPGDAGERP